VANDANSDDVSPDDGSARAERTRRRLQREIGGNAILLATLVVLLVVLPFVPGPGTQGVVSRIVWTVVIVAGIFRASGRRWFLWAALVIAVPSLLSNWVDIFGLGEAGPLVVALFFALISAQILADIFSRDRVELDQILGGVNVYLLLGIMFARLHVAVEHFAAGSYTLGDLPIASAVLQAGQQLGDVMLYFSFITLTTLGYGDILPVSEVARRLATVEAVVGQLFVAILIARLVSAHTSRPSRDDRAAD
jgi:voltage-gated potassium channel Kch